MFSVVRKGGGFAYAVYSENKRAERRQNDTLQESKRVNGYGPNDYRDTQFTFDWLCMRIEDMIARIDKARNFAVEANVAQPPRHLHDRPDSRVPAPSVNPTEEPDASPEQPSLL